MALERVWIGSVAAGHESDHETFVGWLASEDGERMFRQYRLTAYELREGDGKLVVAMQAQEPTIIIHFLRNPRAWPDFWKFASNSPSDVPTGSDSRVHWRLDESIER
jgi:hypothetical protein